MIETKRNGGITEFIPTPSEKRESLIRDYFFTLLANLNDRLCRLESRAGVSSEESEDLNCLLKFIQTEEIRNQVLHQEKM